MKISDNTNERVKTDISYKLNTDARIIFNEKN